MRIAVAGGTGVVGRHVVDAARGQGHEVVVLSRRSGVDVLAGTGLDAALAGVDAVVDCLNTTAQRAAVAAEFFTSTTRRLGEAGQRAGVRHHVTLSIVGIDDPGLEGFGYYAGKRAQEAAVAEGPVPWSVLRATQFHEFAEQMLSRMSVGPVAAVPAMLCQPVAASEVGAALVELATLTPVGRATDVGGPQRESLVSMARRAARARGRRGLVLPLAVPGATGRAMRNGALCLREGRVAGPTYDEWLG
jgi:uncharacterized protein YbjT (DUF2867 family)